MTASVSAGGGAAGDSDGYSPIENIVGGAVGDTLTGNVLDGGYATTPCPSTPLTGGRVASALRPCTSYSGNDTLFGNGGADTLVGRGGDDVLRPRRLRRARRWLGGRPLLPRRRR